MMVELGEEMRCGRCFWQGKSCVLVESEELAFAGGLVSQGEATNAIGFRWGAVEAGAVREILLPCVATYLLAVCVSWNNRAS